MRAWSFILNNHGKYIRMVSLYYHELIGQIKEH